MSDNPLKQYFRRPAVYITLPSQGEGYPEGVIEMTETTEIPIYPMTAIDEITSRTPDALFNGTAVVEIIKSCVPNIKDPWQLNSIDLDPILVAIRAATHGSDMEIETTCPACEEIEKYDVHLPTVLAGFTPGNYKQPLAMDDVTIKFKPLTFAEVNKAGLDQFQVQKMLQNISTLDNNEEREARSKEVMNQINDLSTNLVASSIEYIKVPTATVFEKEFILEFLVNISRAQYDKIRDQSIELRKSTENKPLKIKCSHCQHDYEQTFNINATDFFE